MNLIDFHVTAVLSEPIKKTTSSGTNYWQIKVTFSDWGGPGQTKTITCFSEEQVNKIKPGYVGQH